MSKITATPIKRLNLRTTAEKPDLIILDLETAEGSHYYAMPAADLYKMADLFSDQAAKAQTALGKKI